MKKFLFLCCVVSLLFSEYDEPFESTIYLENFKNLKICKYEDFSIQKHRDYTDVKVGNNIALIVNKINECPKYNSSDFLYSKNINDILYSEYINVISDILKYEINLEKDFINKKIDITKFNAEKQRIKKEKLEILKAIQDKIKSIQ